MAAASCPPRCNRPSRPAAPSRRARPEPAPVQPDPRPEGPMPARFPEPWKTGRRHSSLDVLPSPIVRARPRNPVVSICESDGGVFPDRTNPDGPRVRGSPSLRHVELDRQVLTEEEATSSLLLAGVVQGVGREAGLSRGGRGCLHLEVEAADLNRLGPVALRRLERRGAIVHPSAPAIQTRSGVDSLFQCALWAALGAEDEVDPSGPAGRTRAARRPPRPR